MLEKFRIPVTMAMLTVAAVSIPSFTVAANPGEQQMLQARYDSVRARAGFITGIMTDIVSLVPQASNLTAHIDRLSTDLTELSSFVPAGNPAGFSSIVSENINPDIQAAHQAMAEARTHYREWNVTPQTRQALKTKYDERKATYDSQMQAVAVRLGNIRLSNYNNVVAKYDARIEKLTARDIDVSGMQIVKAGALANVITPLQAAVASGDAALIRAELKDKSLDNGAPYSYHFRVKMDTTGGQAVTARIADNATRAGYGDQLAEVNANLAAVQSILDTVGTNPYTTELKDSIWSSLKAAAGQLEDIIKALGGN